MLLIRKLVLVLLLSLALSLTLPLTSLELSLNLLILSSLFLCIHVSVLFVSALCGLTMNIALIVYATIQITLSLTHPAWSILASLLLTGCLRNDDYRGVFNELWSATGNLVRARIHFVLLFYLLLNLRTVPIFLLKFGRIRCLCNVVTPTYLRLNLLDGACHLFHVHLRLVFSFLLKAVAISLLFIKILTLIGIRSIFGRFHRTCSLWLRLTIFGGFS